MTAKVEENKDLLEDDWMIRPCKAYLEEYKDCRGIKGRFHQHFVYGKSLDCSQWRRDYDSCVKWTGSRDIKAANSVIESETSRRLDRLRGHYGNTVWEKRDNPPEEWNKPLPDYMQEQYKDTWLYQKCKEDEESAKSKLESDNSSFCVIQ